MQNDVFQTTTPKHLGRYADEFDFRLESFTEATAGKRITYKDLIQ